MSILEECPEENLTDKENSYIQELSPEFNSKIKSGRKKKVFKSVATTVRLTPDMAGQLKQASYLLHKSQTEIISNSLEEYFEKYNIQTGYQLNLTETKAVLQKMGPIPTVIDVVERNGQSPQELQKHFAVRLNEPVRLVIQEKPTWPKKQS